MKKAVIISLSLLPCITAFSQSPYSFHSSNVAKIAALLPPGALDSIAPGNNSVAYDGKDLTVRVNANNQVEHIGIKLFPSELREANGLAIYDFLEQASLKSTLLLSEYSDEDSGIAFKKGGWADLAKADASTIVAVNTLENVRYNVDWINDADTLLSIEIPMRYDRLLQADRDELEQIYLSDLQSFSNYSLASPTPCSPDCVKTIKGNAHLQPNINQDIYYDANGGLPVYCAEYPVETLVNQINAYPSIASGRDIAIKFNLYGSKKQIVTVPLAQFLAFCASKSEAAYVGVERVADDAIEMSLFLDNPNSGYEHVVFIRCSPNDAANDEISLQAEAYLYSPTRIK